MRNLWLVTCHGFFNREELLLLLPQRREEHNVNLYDHNDMHDMLSENFGFSNQYVFTDDDSP